MAYLVDFLALSFPVAQEKKVLASSEFKEWEELREHCDIMIERGYFTGDHGSLSKPEQLVLKKEARLVDTIWKKYHFVPDDMEYSALRGKGGSGYFAETCHLCTRDKKVADLVKFSGCLQAKLSDIREVANKLSLMILPFCYFSQEKLGEISREISHYSVIGVEEIEKLVLNIAEYTQQDLYVLCPISLYDFYQAESDRKQREVVFGGELVQAKITLDTIIQIQRNMFAILNGNEGDTGIWEIGEGVDRSNSELAQLRVIIETIMPIQRSLLRIAQKSKDLESWEKMMRENHCDETSKILRDLSRKLSWSEEAIEALREAHAAKIKKSQKASWVIPEAVAMTSILFFSLPHGTSLIHGDGLARVIRHYGIDMPESFYIDRGFAKCRNDEEKMLYLNDEICVSL